MKKELTESYEKYLQQYKGLLRLRKESLPLEDTIEHFLKGLDIDVYQMLRRELWTKTI